MWTLDSSSGDWDFSQGGAGKVITGDLVLKQWLTEAICTLTGTDVMDTNYGCLLESLAGTSTSLSSIENVIKEAVGEEITRIQGAYQKDPDSFLPSQVPVSYVVINTGSNSWEVLLNTLGQPTALYLNS